MISLSQKQKEAFLEKIDKNSSDSFYNGERCWLWKLSKTPLGYGKVNINYFNTYSHRVSWVIFFGDIPDKIEVCHKCDNPGCCNPNHLFIGSHKDNMNDRDRKGRNKGSLYFLSNIRFGENVCNSKLTTQQVIEIRRIYENKEKNQSQIAREYGVSANQINLIVHNKSWKKYNI